MSHSLKTIIARQRMLLQGRLATAFDRLVAPCRAAWPDRAALEGLLILALPGLSSCKYIYILDADARQLTANVSPQGLLPEHYGRDRSQRPYLAEALAGERFSLSPIYISRNARRPSLTAIRRIEDEDGQLMGFLGADFDLRELPLTRKLYEQPGQWVQLKGDPAIRAGLFQQERVESLLDRHIDEILALVVELITTHGVFHGKLHFSSSRANLWLMDDPFRYRILDYEDLADPGICLAYPTRPYPEDAAIPPHRVSEVLANFKALRLMDENIYLRSGSLNIFNGIVGLNFSCDGSHYMPWDEFLHKSLAFWLGSGESCVLGDVEAQAEGGQVPA